VIQDHSDHGASKEPNESVTRVDSSVVLMHHDPSDHGSLILIQITTKERTLCFRKPRGKIVNLIGLKIIINVSKTY